jgi:hypothetical protein
MSDCVVIEGVIHSHSCCSLWSIGHPWNASLLCVSMAYSPCGLGSFFNFSIYTESVALLGRESARRKAATYTAQNKHRINLDKHPYLQWDSNLRPQCSNGRRQFMPKTARAL